MSTKEKYSDRRHNQRRQERKSGPALETLLPDQNIREGDRRCDPRRQCERQNVSFEVLIDHKNGETTNVSASGIYFEVPTTDIRSFFSGDNNSNSNKYSYCRTLF